MLQDYFSQFLYVFAYLMNSLYTPHEIGKGGSPSHFRYYEFVREMEVMKTYGENVKDYVK